MISFICLCLCVIILVEVKACRKDVYEMDYELRPWKKRSIDDEQAKI